MWQAQFLEMENNVGDHPIPLIEQRAEPCIHRHTDGYYYFTAAVPQQDRIELRRAKTIEGLASAQTRIAWRKPATGPCAGLVRAPAIRFHQGAWYVYFAAAPSRDMQGELRLYALRSTSPNPLEGGWEFLGPVETGSETGCAGAATFAHNGALYCAWTQRHGGDRGGQTIPASDGDAALYLAPMRTPWQVAGAPVLLGRLAGAVGAIPAVLKKHGKVFIACPAGADGHAQALGLLWADEHANLLDPASWHTPEQSSPTPAAAAIDGPAHAGFAVAADGSTVLLVYHARTYTEIEGVPLWSPDRHTFVKPLRWTADGMPDTGQPSTA